MEEVDIPGLYNIHNNQATLDNFLFICENDGKRSRKIISIKFTHSKLELRRFSNLLLEIN